MDENETGLKYGNRNNADDRGRIRKVRALASEMVNVTRELEPDDEDEKPTVGDSMKSTDIDETIVAFGGEIKALGQTDEGLHLGGHLVVFGSPTQTDVSGFKDYFTKDTDFDLEPGEQKPVSIYFHHRQPIKASNGDFAVVKSKVGRGTIALDDTGVLIDAIIYNSEQYQKVIAQHATKMGWSSGTASHLIDREKQPNGSNWIKKWPLGGDASLTPTPAEPRNFVALKSLFETVDDGALMDASAGETAAQDSNTEQPAQPEPIKTFGGIEMDITQETLAEMLNTAAAKGAEQALKSLPAVTSDVKVTKDAAEQPFGTSGEFFQAVKMAAIHPMSEDARLRPLKATGMSEGVPADGGYLLQSQLASGILERTYSTGAILSRVASDTVGPNSNGMLYNGVDETTRVDGSRQGGLLGYWLSEAATKTKSKPAFYQMELKLKKVVALCYATDEQLQDTVNLESWLMRSVPNELRFRVEDAIFNGDGIGKPLGFMQAAALVTPLRETASTITAADIANMWARRWSGYNDYVWLIHPSAFPSLINLTVGNFPLLAINGIAGAPFATIYGRPVVETEYNATLGDVGDIVLASLSQYQTINKGGIQSASSIHVQFVTDETAFRFVYRIDGQPAWHSALTPFKGSSTVSPFVALSSASV
jgi:HK97 family phage major capsid protein